MGVQVTDWSLWRHLPYIFTDARITEMQSGSSTCKMPAFSGNKKNQSSLKIAYLFHNLKIQSYCRKLRKIHFKQEHFKICIEIKNHPYPLSLRNNPKDISETLLCIILHNSIHTIYTIYILVLSTWHYHVSIFPGY